MPKNVRGIKKQKKNKTKKTNAEKEKTGFFSLRIRLFFVFFVRAPTSKILKARDLTRPVHKAQPIYRRTANGFAPKKVLHITKVFRITKVRRVQH